MHLTTCVRDLLAGLALVGRAVSAKSFSPILSNVLLDASGGRLSLTCTNLDVTLTTSVDAQVEVPGMLTVSARMLDEFLDSVPSDAPVTVEEQGQRVRIKAGGFEALLATLPAEDFPPTKTVVGQSLTLGAHALRDAIGRVAYAAASAASRPVLQGVELAMFGDPTRQLRLSAADGYRASIRTLEIGEDAPDLDCIVPAKSLKMISSMLPDDAEGLVHLVASENELMVRSADCTAVARLISGTFPDVRRIVPAQTTTQVTAEVASLLGALRLGRALDKDDAVARLTIDSERVVVSASSAEVGEMTAEVAVQVEGEPLEMRINGGYLFDALRALSTDQAVIELAGAMLPVVVREPGARNGCLALVMPMGSRG